jgi:hypothetical protein
MRARRTGVPARARGTLSQRGYNCMMIRIRVRLEIIGSQTCGIVGTSQTVCDQFVMIHPMIFIRTWPAQRVGGVGSRAQLR